MVWTLKRLLISALLIVHWVLVTAWILPGCALKAQLIQWSAYYLMPTGQWQYWGMFAPDPIQDSVAVEAVVVDNQGLLHTFAFPKEANRSRWDASLHYRHSKYACNFSIKEEFKAHREFAARHAIRQLHLTADRFPAEVRLMYQVKRTPPPGTLPDPMTPLVSSVIDTYQFPTLQEALP